MGCIPSCQRDNQWDTSLLPKNIGPWDNSHRMSGLPPDASHLAREIHRRMRLMGLGQKSLALGAGLNETYVRDILSGKSLNPKSEQLAKLARFLGCTVLDLIGPDPFRAGTQPRPGDLIKDAEEAAIIGVWRVLRPAGRERMLQSIKAAAPSRSNRRKVND